jgi:large subunit ribosomal protein L35
LLTRVGNGTEDEESTAAMPKNKTHSGAKKRFKITGTGKVLRQQAGLRHRLEVKSSRETRALQKDAPVSPADAKKAKRLLGL